MRTTTAATVLLLCSFGFLDAYGQPVAAIVASADLIRAIRGNDLVTLQNLASNAATANTVDKLKSTPLHYAAIYGSPAAIRILLKVGADPNARNENGATPLLYAAWDLERTRLLVESGAAVNTAQNGGITPLMVAVSAHGNVGTVRYLIENGAHVRDVDRFQNDALMRSADPEMVQVLLDHGADPHRANVAGFSALHTLFVFRDYDRVRPLLTAGADPNQLNTFSGIVKKGPIAMVHQSTLMVAAPHGELRTITALLDSGANVNEVDIRKMSPLMLAIATDQPNPSVVRRLISAGADVNAKDQNGESVLTWARKFRNPEILAVLDAAGAQGEQLPQEPRPEPGSQAPDPAHAIGRAIPLLATSGVQFFRESGCAGCHHQMMQARVFSAAASAKLNPDPALRKGLFDAMLSLRPEVASLFPVLSIAPGDYDPALANVMALADLDEPANEMTDLVVHYIAARQHPSGAWIHLGLARPPQEDSSITTTAMAIRALKRYGWPARQAEFDDRIRRAQLWLQNATPVTAYEMADKLMGLKAAGVPVANLTNDASALLHLQHPDGGWSQTRYLDSDAYATGLVLHTLYTTGLASANDPAYRKGVAFLLRTQFPDGSWYVRSRAPKFQPYFQSGFPFNHDQWISATATSFAVMALAPAANPVR